MFFIFMMVDQKYSFKWLRRANGPYYDGSKITVRGAMPDDGLLNVALFKSASPLLTMWFMRKYSQGEIPSNYVFLEAKKIAIQSDEPMWIQQDGEFLQDTKFTFEVVPEALKFAVVNDLTYQKN